MGVFIQFIVSRSQEQAKLQQFCKDIREAQKRTRCTEATVINFIQTFEKYLKIPVMARASLRRCDKNMQQKAGCHFIILNGCVGCDRFVYLPNDKRTHCPRHKPDGSVCGAARYKLDGKPREVCVCAHISCLYVYNV